jgi:hypothetical protein
MSAVNFEQLPDTARLWVFGSTRPLNHEQVQMLTENMSRFLAQWDSHQKEVTAAWQLKYNQFILIGVDETKTAISGCSIDSMVHNLRAFEQRSGSDILNTSSQVFYRDANKTVQCITREEFGQLVENGVVSEDTIVFDNSIQSIRELRWGKWEIPMKDS